MGLLVVDSVVSIDGANLLTSIFAKVIWSIDLDSTYVHVDKLLQTSTNH